MVCKSWRAAVAPWLYREYYFLWHEPGTTAESFLDQVEDDPDGPGLLRHVRELELAIDLTTFLDDGQITNAQLEEEYQSGRAYFSELQILRKLKLTLNFRWLRASHVGRVLRAIRWRQLVGMLRLQELDHWRRYTRVELCIVADGALNWPLSHYVRLLEDVHYESKEGDLVYRAQDQKSCPERPMTTRSAVEVLSVWTPVRWNLPLPALPASLGSLALSVVGDYSGTYIDVFLSYCFNWLGSLQDLSILAEDPPTAIDDPSKHVLPALKSFTITPQSVRALSSFLRALSSPMLESFWCNLEWIGDGAEWHSILGPTGWLPHFLRRCPVLCKTHLYLTCGAYGWKIVGPLLDDFGPMLRSRRVMFTVKYNARRYAGDQNFTPALGAGLGEFLAEALLEVNLHLDQYCSMEEKELVPTVYPHVRLFGLTIAGKPADLRNMDRIFRELDLLPWTRLFLNFPLPMRKHT